MNAFNGAWKADLERSNFKSGAPAELAAKVELIEGRLRVAMRVTLPDGRQHRTVLRCATGGLDGTMEFDGQAVRGKADRFGDALLFDWWMPSRDAEIHLRDWWTISPDGETLTMEHRDDVLSGQIIVFQRW